MSHYIGIDIGTTHIKAVVADDGGRPLFHTNRSCPSEQLHKGWHEQDAHVLLTLVIEVLNESLIYTGDKPSYVCFSAGMHSLLAVDKDGVPLCKMMTWADTRSNEYALQLKATERGSLIYRQTGTPVHPMSPLCKIAWMRDHQPELYAAAFKFISIKEYIFFQFFGEYVVDYSMASATGLFDIRKLNWCDDALSFAGIDATRVSQPVTPTKAFNRFKSNVSKQLKIDHGMTFFVGAGDGFLANVGAGAVSNGELALTIGTSGAIRKLGNEIVDDRNESLFNYAFDGQSYLTGGAINNGGIVLQWLAKLFFTEKTTEDAFVQMMHEAATIDPGAEGLIFLPYIYGERAPVWDAAAKGVFIGINANHTRAHFIRAAIEGICFSLLQIMRTIEQCGVPVTAVFANGGFIRSKLWLRIMADVLNKDLFVSYSGDASAMGAIYLAMLVTGKIESWNDVKKLVSIDETYHPRPALSERYRRSFNIYEHLYEKLKADFTAIDSWPDPDAAMGK